MEGLREHAGKVLVAVAAFVLLLIFWRYNQASALDALLPNLLSEAIGICLTVIFVDALLRAAERRRTRLPRFGAYDEAIRILENFESLWLHLIEVTATEPPQPPANPFADRFRRQIADHLDVRSKPLKYVNFPSWIDLFEWYGREIKSGVDRCIQRYALFADPELLHALRRIENSAIISFFTYVRSASLIGAARFDVSMYDPAPFEALHELLTRSHKEFEDLPDYRSPLVLSVGDIRGDSPFLGSSRLGPDRDRGKQHAPPVR